MKRRKKLNWVHIDIQPGGHGDSMTESAQWGRFSEKNYFGWKVWQYQWWISNFCIVLKLQPEGSIIHNIKSLTLTILGLLDSLFQFNSVDCSWEKDTLVVCILCFRRCRPGLVIVWALLLKEEYMKMNLICILLPMKLNLCIQFLWYAGFYLTLLETWVKKKMILGILAKPKNIEAQAEQKYDDALKNLSKRYFPL